MMNVISRFATQVLPKIGKQLSYLRPRSGADAALRYMPELVWPIYSMAQLPEGTPLNTRMFVAGEDLGINLLGSLGGQAIGLGVGKNMATNRLRKQGKIGLNSTLDDLYEGFDGIRPPAGLDADMARLMEIGPAINVGDISGSMAANMFLPRNQLQKAWAAAEGTGLEGMDQQALLQILAEIQRREELGGFSATAANPYSFMG